MLLVTAGRNGNDGEQAVGSIVLAVRSVLSDGPVVDVSGMRTVDCSPPWGSVDRLSLLTDWDISTHSAYQTILVGQAIGWVGASNLLQMRWSRLCRYASTPFYTEGNVDAKLCMLWTWGEEREATVSAAFSR